MTYIYIFKIQQNIRIFSLLIVLFTVSCKKDLVDENNVNKTKSSNANEMMILGEKLENPYKLSNMQSAYNLIKEERNLPKLTLEASHIYVRFLPKKLEEYNTLIYENEDLIFFDYPLDYDIAQDGSYYIDPSFLGQNYTWQYTVVPKDFTFPSLQYEIIDNAFIPDESVLYNNANSPLSNGDLEALIDKAYEITGNADELSSAESGKTNATWWTPEATVEVVDNDLGLKSSSLCHKLASNGNTYLEGITIKTQSFLKIAKGVTSNYGKAVMNKQYKTKVRFRMHFSTNKFRLALISPLIPKIMVGPNQKTHWYPTISMATSTLDARSAMVFMAAYDFIHRPIVRGPITIPYSGTTTNPTTIVIDNVLNPASHAIFATNATVFRYTKDESTKRAYTVTIHELGHLSHKVGSPLNYNVFINNYGLNRPAMAVGESWAEGVEWYIAQHKYTYTNNSGFNQRKSIHTTNTNGGIVIETYTQLVRDLVDMHNENFMIYDEVNLKEMVLPGECGFLIENDILYYTPYTSSNPCPVPNTYYNGQYCVVTELPEIYSYNIYGNNKSVEILIPDPHPLIEDLPFDPVSGYSMAQIQTALYQSATWHGWRNKLEDATNNPDEKFLEILFNNWYQN